MTISAGIDKEKPRILIVDDTPANLRLLTSILTEEEYMVHPANSGEHALRFLQSVLPDLILLDIRMPGLDGYQTCAQLKSDERTRDIPVIFISAADEASDKAKAFTVGGVDYIVKPFQIEEVLTRIGTHLSLRMLQKRFEECIQERSAALLLDTHKRLNEKIIVAGISLLEKETPDNRQLLQSIIDNSPAAIYVTDLEGRYMWVNRHFAILFNVTCESIIGKTGYDVLPQPYAALCHSADQRLLIDRLASSVEESIRLDSGVHTYISTRYLLHDDVAGNPYAICGISVEITHHSAQ